MLKASKHEAGSEMSNHYDPSEMMTLIGSRCKRSNALSRGVLIDQVSSFAYAGEGDLRIAMICCPYYLFFTPFFGNSILVARR